MSCRTVVVKLGGSVITKKAQGLREVKEDTLASLSGELRVIKEEEDLRLVVVHGAGPFGHVLAEKYELNKGLTDFSQLMGFAQTHKSMEKLNSQVIDSLLVEGLAAVPLQPSCMGVMHAGRISRFAFEACQNLLDLGMVPVGYGDVLIDLKQGVGILSGDQLSCFLAEKLGASSCIFVTDYNGLFEGKPGESTKLDSVRRSDLDGLLLGKSKAADVTGGISGKIREIMDLAEKGVYCEIIGAHQGNLLKALTQNEVVGTRILA